VKSNFHVLLLGPKYPHVKTLRVVPTDRWDTQLLPKSPHVALSGQLPRSPHV